MNIKRKEPVHNLLFAQAHLYGSRNFPGIFGLVNFFDTNNGVTVSAKVFNLPKEATSCPQRFFAFHMHDSLACFDENDKGHYNPYGCNHPSHAGDFPPLLNNNGQAYLEFTTGAFSPPECIGKTVVIHLSPDDFTSQPSGNSGEKIACGVITAV